MRSISVPAPMRRAAASAYLKEKFGIERSTATLAKYACVGGGPVFQRAGRVPIYTVEALDNYAASITSPPVRSNSELRTARGVASNRTAPPVAAQARGGADVEA